MAEDKPRQQVRTSKRHFDLFKREFKRIASLWGLGHYDIGYSWENIENMAEFDSDVTNQVVTVRFPKQWDVSTPLTEQNIREVAKHEVIHLLLARFSELAYDRHAPEGTLYAAEEELVQRLMNLIPV